MPAIWNIGNYNSVNDKKLSSKLTFKVGESFKGQIIGKGDGDTVTIKLVDGWEFPAELLGDITSDAEGLLQFKVEGFKDGKVEIKLLQQAVEENASKGEEAVGEFAKREGLTSDDETILNAMIKHKMPLTKENISFVKSVVNFNEKININPQEVDKFIENFLSGKGIDSKSVEGQQIKDTLMEFFDKFKEMDQKDIFMFLENGIDFNEENIDSYNKLFKQDINLKEYFSAISKELKDLNLPELKGLNIGNEVNPKGVEENKNSQLQILKQNMATKLYDNNSNAKAKVSVISLFKSMVGEEENIVKSNLKNILVSNKDNFNGSEFRVAFSKLDSLSEKDLVSILKNSIVEGNPNITKDEIEKTLSNLVGKNIVLTQEESNKLVDTINLKYGVELKDNKAISEENTVRSQNQITREGNENILNKGERNIQAKEAILNKSSIEANKELLKTTVKLASGQEIKNEIGNKLDGLKDVIKDIMLHSKNFTNEGIEKALSSIKSNLNDFKLFNSISNEYYYVDVPINKSGDEYPCKLIIKDDRKDNKKIDKSNVKVVVAVKTLNLGTVDGYITVHGNNITVNMKCEERVTKILNMAKEKLILKLQEVGYLANVSVSPKAEEVNLSTCREFFDDKDQSAINIRV
ncbi:MAG: hypothetical protein E7214_03090 [Clostridium sp.]|nr:hypothetical protein [Clostridium sp.]